MTDILPSKSEWMRYLNIASSACTAAGAAGLAPRQPLHKTAALAGLVIANCYNAVKEIRPDIQDTRADKCASGITLASSAILNVPVIANAASIAQRFKALCFMGAGACSASQANFGLTLSQATSTAVKGMAVTAHGMTAAGAAGSGRPIAVSGFAGSAATKTMSAFMQLAECLQTEGSDNLPQRQMNVFLDALDQSTESRQVGR